MSSLDEDLDRLDELLAALPQVNLPMTLSELDGYVTGILSCPQIIPPSDWLPHVWGETGDANFPDLATAEATISAVMAHYNSVAAVLRKTPDPSLRALCNWKTRFARSIPMRVASTWMLSPSVMASHTHHSGTLRCRREGASTPSTEPLQ